jgi:siroheme synthase-like protein
MLEMRDQPVLCVGAGPVAAGKVVPMIECGAIVTVIAPSVDAGLHRAAELVRRPYEPGDVDRDPRPRLVVAGTGVAQVDAAVAEEAARLGIWCLRIDGQGDVAAPATIRRGQLVVSLVTGAPALTRRLRMALTEALDERWVAASATLSTLREDPTVRAALAEAPPLERRRRWRRAVEALLDGGDSAGAEQILSGRRGGRQ